MEYPTDLILEYDALLASDSMVTTPKNNSRIDWKSVLPTALTAAIFVGGVLWAAHSEISKIDDRLVNLDKHISRVETAVRIVGAKQGGDTKTLIDEALTVAKKASAAGHVDNAKTIVAYANRLLSEQKHYRIEAPQEFFASTLDNYQSLGKSPDLRESARAGTFLLAEYRSALQPQPELPTKTDNALPQLAGNPKVVLYPSIYQIVSPLHTHTNIDVIGTGAATLQASFADRDMLIPDSKRWETNRATISGINIIDGNQSLDGFIWDNVTFANMHIRYAHGTALLHNVRFVNCTFDLPSDDTGTRIANYVALGNTGELAIG